MDSSAAFALVFIVAIDNGKAVNDGIGPFLRGEFKPCAELLAINDAVGWAVAAAERDCLTVKVNIAVARACVSAIFYNDCVAIYCCTDSFLNCVKRMLPGSVFAGVTDVGIARGWVAGRVSERSCSAGGG